jgi:CRP-like cAMP-binding protein
MAKTPAEIKKELMSMETKSENVRQLVKNGTTLKLYDNWLFRDMDSSAKLAIYEHLVPKTFKNDEEIICEGTTPSGVYIILEGKVRVESSTGLNVLRDQELELCDNLIGEIAFISRSNTTASVYAHGSVEALFLSAEALEEIKLTNPSVNAHLQTLMLTSSRDRPIG